MSVIYPTDGQLEAIRNWKCSDLHGLMEFIQPLWTFADWGWRREGDIYHISTGGWSGNEDIVAAMEENYMWWMIYWEQSTRGGHYIFAPLSAILKLKEVGKGENRASS